MNKKQISSAASEMGKLSWKKRLQNHSGNTDFMAAVGRASKGVKKNKKGISRQRVHQIKTGYHTLFSKSLREKILKRDNYCCTRCKNSKAILEIHHADGNHQNNVPENLAIVCKKCHTVFHKEIKALKTIQ